MSPHLATGLRAAAWRGGVESAARDEDGEGVEPRAGTGPSFRRACLIIAAWLLALILVPILFTQPF